MKTQDIHVISQRSISGVSYITLESLVFDMSVQKQLEYAHPEVLVETQWTEDHLNDAKVRIVEVDYDSDSNYNLGHIPGSVLFEWKKDINEPLSRNILTRQTSELLQKGGTGKPRCPLSTRATQGRKKE